MIKFEICEHFKDRFRSVNNSISSFGIGVEDNNRLIAEFTEEEIKKAIRDYISLKSPGSNGVNFGFIKELWETIKGDVIRSLAEFHANGKIVREANDAFIVFGSEM